MLNMRLSKKSKEMGSFTIVIIALVWVDHGSTHEYFVFLKFQDMIRIDYQKIGMIRIESCCSQFHHQSLCRSNSNTTWIITTILSVTLKFVACYVDTLFFFPSFTSYAIIVPFYVGPHLTDSPNKPAAAIWH